MFVCMYIRLYVTRKWLASSASNLLAGVLLISVRQNFYLHIFVESRGFHGIKINSQASQRLANATTCPIHLRREVETLLFHMARNLRCDLGRSFRFIKLTTKKHRNY
ncbi:hypothetical protein L798_10919 [Zootermopsis nevadensis]|uniref:Uncharacterized protein n=1 Tax=Zootermopsis nevadensis TaxID=136037 RepID=A0A067RGT1_ZOONE|nr:hypothetical protein L798_10919 [Zootermopsis nevadensis]